MCHCDGGSQYGLYGIYNSHFNNMMTGGQSCPNGTAPAHPWLCFFGVYLDETSLCVIDALIPSSMYELPPPRSYGGIYTFYGGTCVPNVKTGSCSCPNYAPLSLPVDCYTLSVGTHTQVPITTFMCMGIPVCRDVPPSGNFRTYVSLQ